jgi:hypothetical protein
LAKLSDTRDPLHAVFIQIQQRKKLGNDCIVDLPPRDLHAIVLPVPHNIVVVACIGSDLLHGDDDENASWNAHERHIGLFL